MRYAQSGIHGYIPPAGACPGHRYEDRADRSDAHMSTDCPRCEPWQAKDPLWAATAAEVPLTEAEKQETEAVKKAADSLDARQVLMFAAALASGKLGEAMTAIGMPPAQLAALGAAVPVAPVAAPAPAPVPAPVPASTAPVAGTQAPARTARARKPTAKVPA